MLDSMDLLYRLELPLSLSVTALINQLSDLMRASPSMYSFTASPYTTSRAILPLHLLGLVDKGRPRPSDGQVRLRPNPVPSTLTLRDLVSDRNSYAAPVCIVNGRLSLHFSASFVFIAEVSCLTLNKSS